MTNALHERRLPDFLANFTEDGTGRSLGTTWYQVLVGAKATITAPDGGEILRVVWTLPGDRRAASNTVAAVLADRSGRTVVGRVTETDGAPIWALGQTRVTSAEHGSLITSGASDGAAQVWAERLDRASVAVSSAGVVAPTADWAGGLVVELPADIGDFRTISGVDSAEASAATECGSGTPRIVVNPEVLGEDGTWLDAMLAHEAVHVATDSPCADDPPFLWATEGLAESVAAKVDPLLAGSNRKLVRSYLGQHGVPEQLPTSVQDLTQYALAEVAAEQVLAHLSPTAAVDFFDRAIRNSGAVTDAELSGARSWYRAELARIARSS